MGRKSSQTVMKKREVSTLLECFSAGISVLTGCKIDRKSLRKAEDIIAEVGKIKDKTHNASDTAPLAEVSYLIGELGLILVRRGQTEGFAIAQDFLRSLPGNKKDVMSLLGTVKILIENDDIQIILKYSLSTGVITVGSSIIGGFVFALNDCTWTGCAIGIGIGCLISFYFFYSNFYSLVEIFHRLPKSEQKKLARYWNRFIGKISINSILNLINNVTTTISCVCDHVKLHYKTIKY